VTLANLALGKVKVPKGKIYVALRAGEITFPPPSILAQNDSLIEELWVQSEKLLSETTKMM